MKQPVSLVIFDLDNTLWDWVEIWHASFSAMLTRLATDSGVPIAQLKEEFRAIHQRHGTAEYAFSVEELPSLRAKHPGQDVRQIYSAAIDDFRAARAEHLKTYLGVVETLEILRHKGCLLVGYTESMAYYTAYRLRECDLDRLVDYLYSPPDHDLPKNMDPEQHRKYSSVLDLRRTVHRHTPRGELKPNPKLLLDIIEEVGGTPETAIYIGDSELKDVAMAQAAGVTDVWAKYGVAQKRPEYSLLKEVTHWSAAAVERERAMADRAEGEGIKPTFVLKIGFAEILNLFRFGPFNHPTPEKADHAVAAWQKTVDVQQHFNDIELRIRNFAVTLFAAVISGVALAAKEDLEIHIWGLTIPLASAVAWFGLIPWLMFYFMDKHWYHVFLKAAGMHAGAIEKRWAAIYPELGLSTRIGKASTYKFPHEWLGWKMSSTQRLSWFYRVGALALFLLGIAAFHVDVRKAHTTPPLLASRQVLPPTPALQPQLPPAPKGLGG